MPRRRRSFVLPALVSSALTIASPLVVSARAQAAGGTPCWGFAFGTWTPALDWQRGGHAGAPRRDYATAARDSAARREAAERPAMMQELGARGDYVTWDSTGSEPTLMIVPSWWPAGVIVRLTPGARGDTLTGTASALVADLRRAAPTSPVRLWKRACSR